MQLREGSNSRCFGRMPLDYECLLQIGLWAGHAGDVEEPVTSELGLACLLSVVDMAIWLATSCRQDAWKLFRFKPYSVGLFPCWYLWLKVGGRSFSTDQDHRNRLCWQSKRSLPDEHIPRDCTYLRMLLINLKLRTYLNLNTRTHLWFKCSFFLPEVHMLETWSLVWQCRSGGTF